LVGDKTEAPAPLGLAVKHHHRLYDLAKLLEMSPEFRVRDLSKVEEANEQRIKLNVRT
jgi:hypothetical protein